MSTTIPKTFVLAAALLLVLAAIVVACGPADQLVQQDLGNIPVPEPPEVMESRAPQPNASAAELSVPQNAEPLGNSRRC